VNDGAPSEVEIASLLRAEEADALPPRLASGHLWREIEARRARRSLPIFAPSSLDAAAVLQAALTPALGG